MTGNQTVLEKLKSELAAFHRDIEFWEAHGAETPAAAVADIQVKHVEMLARAISQTESAVAALEGDRP